MSETIVVYVEQGETLSELAVRHGVTVEQLQQWNQIENPNYVQAGQSIIIHEAAAPPGWEGAVGLWGPWIGGAVILAILLFLFRRKRAAPTSSSHARSTLPTGSPHRHDPQPAAVVRAPPAPKAKISSSRARKTLPAKASHRHGPQPTAVVRAPPAPRTNRGERRVSSALRRRYRNSLLLDNVMLPSGGGTTQIDHILISPAGVFVIETKDMKGWVFGSPGRRNWTQSLMAGRWHRRIGIKSKQFTFYNPLLQNEGHARTLARLGVVDPRQIRPAAVFVGDAELRTADKFVPFEEHEKMASRSRTWRMRGVVCMSLRELHRYIAFSIRASSSPKLTRERMETIRAKITAAAIPVTAESHARHVKFVQSAQGTPR